MTTDRSTTDDRVLGTVRTLGDRADIHVEDSYPTDVEDLWSAVTDPERLARWVARVEGDLRAGGAFRARFTSGWEGPGRIEVCEPPRLLLVTMSPGEDDETTIEARLEPDGERTRLVVEERGLPVAEAPAHGAGWQAHIEDLAAHLTGRPASDWRTRWTELLPAYGVNPKG